MRNGHHITEVKNCWMMCEQAQCHNRKPSTCSSTLLGTYGRRSPLFIAKLHSKPLYWEFHNVGWIPCGPSQSLRHIKENYHTWHCCKLDMLLLGLHSKNNHNSAVCSLMHEVIGTLTHQGCCCLQTKLHTLSSSYSDYWNFWAASCMWPELLS